MTIKWSSQFKKDYRRNKSQGKDLGNFRQLLTMLCNRKKLHPKYKCNVLLGEYKNARECHIQNDWLLIYEFSGNTIILRRMGSHSELFKN